MTWHSEHDDELMEDLRERNKYIHRIKWYVRFESENIPKLKTDICVAEDVKTLDKLCEKYRWTKEDYENFYNYVHED